MQNIWLVDYFIRYMMGVARAARFWLILV